MANLTELEEFTSGIYQLETSDPVIGGADGVDNLQAKQLANRTKYLKAHVDALEDGSMVPPGIATEAYVQDQLERRNFKQSVRLATTADIALTGTQSVDGVAANIGDRVLVKNQTDTSKNGIYLVSGTAWTRAVDADENEDVTAGMVVVVSEGATQADSLWELTTNNPIVLGSTALVFANITNGYAPLASPAFTGNPTAPTAAPGDADGTLATTEFVMKATDGLAPVNMAGGVDVTLTAAQHGLAILNLTGIITANIALIFPNASGQWVVANNTTGSFNITAKTAAGSGVVIPQGSAIVVYGDGTNIFAASAAGQSSLKTQAFAPTAGTTVLTVAGGYTPGAVLVEKNGALLQPTDFTATNGSTVVLTTATITSDKLTVYAFASFEVANAVLKSGDTMAGPLVLAANSTAPTASPGDNSTKIASTAFVAALGALKADLAGSSSQVFSAAAATALAHVVNLGEFVGVSGSPGYIKLPMIVAGVKRTLIVQWGTGSVSGENTDGTFTLAITYPNAHRSVVMTDSATTANNAVVWATNDVNLANFTAHWARSGVTLAGTNRTAFYISIGF